jgi:GNAT superfamily N-acetyltransferase
MSEGRPAATDPRIRGWVDCTVFYLEMTSRPARPPAPPPRTGLEIRRAMAPTLSFYRYHYQAIGHDWTWTMRRLLDDDALRAILHDPRIEVNVLWVDGVPAGLAELDRRQPSTIELGYFGLLPEFIGQGLGRLLLDWAIDRAWMATPSRFWVHTCDLDHPNALSVYQKAGFRLYDRHPARECVLHGMPAPKRLGHTIEVEETP